MPVACPVQFAVVREDPNIELALVDRFGCDQALLVASGGCTALSLADQRPDLRIHLFDFNQHQIDLVNAKRAGMAAGLSAEHAKLFNYGSYSAESLNSYGNFEGLFRGLSQFIYEFVAPYPEWREFFEQPADHIQWLGRTLANKYWPVAFQLFLSDELLHAMFGPDATQHAPAGTYPGYFQERLAAGLRRPDAGTNYFLHHLFLGHYLARAEALPTYLQPNPDRQVIKEFEVTNDVVTEVDSKHLGGMISLSNIFDWMAPEAVAETANWLKQNSAHDTVIVIRQLNNNRPLEQLFAPEFEYLPELSNALAENDRSLFYNRLVVLKKQ